MLSGGVSATITLPKSLTWLGAGALNGCSDIRVYKGTLAQSFCDNYGIPSTLVNGGAVQPSPSPPQRPLQILLRRITTSITQ